MNIELATAAVTRAFVSTWHACLGRRPTLQEIETFLGHAERALRTVATVPPPPSDDPVITYDEGEITEVGRRRRASVTP